MRKITFILIGLAVAAAAVWFYTSPLRTLQGIRAAAEAGDVEGVRERVDVPAVKESIKEQLGTMMQAKMQADPELQNNQFAGLGLVLAGSVVDKMVEAAVTPNSLVALVQGDRQVAFHGEELAIKSDTSPANQPDWEGSFNSTDRYTVKVKDKLTHQTAITLTMRREGLSWRLSAVQLPPDESLMPL